jgi:hypothetical protein
MVNGQWSMAPLLVFFTNNYTLVNGAVVGVFHQQLYFGE